MSFVVGVHQPSADHDSRGFRLLLPRYHTISNERNKKVLCSKTSIRFQKNYGEIGNSGVN